MPLVIMIPVFNDWTAVAQLVREIDACLVASRRTARVLLIDDGSNTAPGADLGAGPHQAIARIDILHLRRNLGHQRAIAIGLAWVEANCPCDALVVMDGDGEDRPTDIDALLTALARREGREIVFAERIRRSEGVVFTVMYHLYRLAHRILTGEGVRVGNFCAIPGALLHRLVTVSDLWNHFAAAVFTSRLPYSTVPTSRGRRYAAGSTMNSLALVTHGLSAMSVFGARIGVRAMTASGLALAVVVAVWIAAAWLAGDGRALPGWVHVAAAALVVLLFQVFVTSMAFVFIVLAARDSPRFLPLRDYVHFVSRVEAVTPRVV